MAIDVPKGFRLTGVHCGLKSRADVEDLTLVVCDSPAVAAGVYTQNVVRAASVVLNSGRTPTDDIRAVANDCFRHRIKLSYEAHVDGVTTDHVIKEILSQVAVA